MEINVRIMDPGEIKEVKKIASTAFFKTPLFSFVFGSANTIVAEVNGVLAGGMEYKIKNIGGKKIAYVNWLYVHPNYSGKGVAGVLLKQGIQQLWDMGCDTLFTFVKDDNAGSWKAFERNGFLRINIKGCVSHLGFAATASLYLTTIFTVAYGCDIYIATKGNNEPIRTVSNIPIYLLFNFIMFAVFVLVAAGSIGYIPHLSITFAYIFLGQIVFGYIATLFSKNKWRFRHAEGGFLLIPMIILQGGFFPLSGNWYPAVYENSRGFKRDMALTTILPWVWLAAPIIAIRLGFTDIMAYINANLVVVFLIYRCIPFGLGSLSGSRVISYNKILWAVMTAGTILLIAN